MEALATSRSGADATPGVGLRFVGVATGERAATEVAPTDKGDDNESEAGEIWMAGTYHEVD